ncbi:MAG: type III-A CRISPR-associated RAMP protein Csm3 [Methanolinea sp.]|nr:type III-A CRISPR-associated RAMP protein Csm3 [Methanolinea sp.]
MGKDLTLIRNYLVSGTIRLETGLHIGGVAESLKIGGTDSPVIMNRITGYPYIPGSSIKGKMRSLLELKHGRKWLSNDGKPHNCEDPECDLCIAFGRGAAKEIEAGPTRLVVRDSFPTEKTIEAWDEKDDILHGTEIKGENYINRITSRADPRFVERVPAGSEFTCEMVFSVYEPKDEERLRLLFEGMVLLEDNYLGGYGSRGSGKVSFRDVTLREKLAEDYRTGADWRPVARTEGARTPREILGRL